MSMTREKIQKAKRKAEAFIFFCDEALKRLDWESENSPWREGKKSDDHSYGSAATGNLRRESMSLTRVLADLRK